MFAWFRNLFSRPALLAPKTSSLFSTDLDFDPAFLDDDAWGAILNKSFQVLPETLKAVNHAGKEVAITGKRDFNPRAPGLGRFAMDAPSDGNPLSFKPVIPTVNLIPPAQLAWYASQGFVGWQTCAVLSQHWLVDKICTTPCRDAIRNGFELATTDDETIDPKVLEAIRKGDKQFGLRKNCVEFARYNRIFGIRWALPIIENKDASYYLKPFDIKKVTPGSYKGMAQIDPYWISPELDLEAAANPASVHFYEPTWWRINGIRIHRSHFVIIRNGSVPDILKPTYYYGGVPIPQKIAERVYAAERTANEGPQIALTKRTTVLHLDVAQAVANFQEFLQRINFFTNTRDNYGVKIVGTNDKLEQYDTSLTDFDDMTMCQYNIACAAGDCPATKIMGTSPKGGLGSEGDYDADSYHEFLESVQEHDMLPLIEMHHRLLIASEIRPKFKSIPEGWQPTINWNPVDTPNAKEQAEINEIESRIGNNLVNSGAIDGVDERNRLMADPDSGYNGLGDRDPEPMDLSGEEDTTGGIKSDKSQAGEKS
jgi:hypothetical protein